MAVFASDDFTDTDGTVITSHTATSGGPWVRWDATVGQFQINGNRCRPNTSGNCLAYITQGPVTAEYDVEADIVARSHIAGSAWGIAGRMSTGQPTYYLVQYFETDRKFYLSRVVNNAFTNLTSVAVTLTIDQPYRVRLQIRDEIKRVFVDGAEILSTTENLITAAGKAGIRSFQSAGNTTGYHLDNFSARDLYSAPNVPSAPRTRRHLLNR